MTCEAIKIVPRVVLKRMVTVTIMFSLWSDSEKVGQPWVKLTSEKEKGPLWSQPASLNERWLEAVGGALKPRRESAC